MINDDELLLFHYREQLTQHRRAQIAAALEADPQLSTRLRQMLADLEAVGSQARIPVPVAAQLRWSRSLQAAARASEPRMARTRAGGHRWLQAACAIVLLVIGVGIGLRIARTDAPRPLAGQDIPADGQAEAFTRGLRLHLADTERLLVGFEQGTPVDRARLLAEIIEQNRLYARAAERAGEPRLARVLRSFEALLSSMDDASLDAQALDAQRAQFDFEIGVMQTKLASDPSKTSLHL